MGSSTMEENILSNASVNSAKNCQMACENGFFAYILFYRYVIKH